jgi:hypothetical protein
MVAGVRIGVSLNSMDNFAVFVDIHAKDGFCDTRL